MPLITRTWIDHESILQTDLDTASALLLDIDGWASWSPGLVPYRSNRGAPVCVGDKLWLGIRPPGMPEFKVPIEIYRWDKEGTEWGGGIPGSVVRHGVSLTAIDEGSCRMRNREYATGLIGLLLLPIEGAAYKQNLAWSKAVEAHFAA